MIKKIFTFFILSTVIFLTGCWETRILDEIALVQIVAFDLDEGEGVYEQTVGFPSYFEAGEEGQLENVTLSSRGRSPKETRNELTRDWQRPLRYGQLRILAFSQHLAEGEGISAFVESFYRDPRVGNQIHLSIMEGEAKKAIDTDHTGARERVGMYFANLIEENENAENIPRSNLHSFLFDFHSDGKDAYLPFLKTVEDRIIVNGLALFDGEKKVAHLGPDESFIFKMILEGSHSGNHTFEVKRDGVDVTLHLDNIHSRVRYEEVKRNPHPHYVVQLDVKGDVDDFIGEVNLENDQHLKAVEDSIANQIEDTGERLINYFVDLNIDPLGFGEQYRSRTRDWDPKEWKETKYPLLTAEVKVDVNILQFGATD
ncbi:Ger(x)C family spore germination protein [Bacillus sp. FJAT-44742]|uniref:Ger(x)C family spore germination protein n=1 Tax=Bacillus sp. FJAT-44742 TaxID=2014005 RepID=UPI000C232176|nr:Ger(x)C family spore germination protein [Bacillus sp. FJAT-44742]